MASTLAFESAWVFVPLDGFAAISASGRFNKRTIFCTGAAPARWIFTTSTSLPGRLGAASMMPIHCFHASVDVSGQSTTTIDADGSIDTTVDGQPAASILMVICPPPGRRVTAGVPVPIVINNSLIRVVDT